MFIHLTYGKSKFFLALVRFYNLVKYQLIRPPLSFISFYCFYIFKFKKWERTANGQPLKEGISVYLPCKNEEMSLTLCLESLLGIANQYILIDNGSTDHTLELMHQFAARYGTEADIEIHSMNEALLVEEQQYALSRVKHRWVLRWDGDMIAIRDSLAKLKKKLKKKFRPAAYILPRLNLAGDYHHVIRFFSPIDRGESFLRTFNNRFQFHEEFGRLENAVVPFYYQLRNEKKLFSIHLSDVRPPTRIMYRHCYLDWRQTMNTGNDSARKRYHSFADFRQDWLQHNFQTSDERSFNFRASRFVANMVEQINPEQLPFVPEEIKSLWKEKNPSSNIIYQDGKPWRMQERDNAAMKNYQPTDEDISWTPDYSRFHTDEIRLAFTNQLS